MIREAVIRGIEQDDYDACGGDLYVHGYVRAIAGAVGIDAQPLIREYDQRQADAPKPAEPTETAVAPETAEPEATVPAITRPEPILTTAAAPDALVPEAAADSAVDAAASQSRVRTQRRVAAIVVLALIVAGAAGGLVFSSLNHHAQAKSTAAGTPALQHAQQGSAGKPAAAQAAKASPAATAKPKAAPTTAKPVQAPSKAPAAAPPRIRALPVKLAEAFGPDGVADGDNPQIAMFAITHGSPLPWQSQWYVTPVFGMLKSGTGLLLDMGRRVMITSVRVQLGPYAGADLQLRAGNKAMVSSSLKVAARANDVGGSVRLRLRSPETARYVLLWFTLLPPNGIGQYQASVYRVVVDGRP